MKPKSTLIILAVIAFSLSACGTKNATSTPDMQSMINDVANTMIAETQAAATTSPAAASSTTAATPKPETESYKGGECIGSLTISKGEKQATILIDNKTSASVGFNLYLKKNASGDCGSWNAPSGIKPNSSLLVTSGLPLGCYYASAWTLSGTPDFQNYGSGPYCVTSTNKFTINVAADGITTTP